MERCLPGYAARAKDALTRERREKYKKLVSPNCGTGNIESL